MVTLAEKGKFKVMENFIQSGSDYSSRTVANHQANILRAKYGMATVEDVTNVPNQD